MTRRTNKHIFCMNISLELSSLQMNLIAFCCRSLRESILLRITFPVSFTMWRKQTNCNEMMADEHFHKNYVIIFSERIKLEWGVNEWANEQYVMCCDMKRKLKWQYSHRITEAGMHWINTLLGFCFSGIMHCTTCHHVNVYIHTPLIVLTTL